MSDGYAGNVLGFVRGFVFVVAAFLILIGTLEYNKSGKRNDQFGQIRAGQKTGYGLGLIILLHVM